MSDTGEFIMVALFAILVLWGLSNQPTCTTDCCTSGLWDQCAP
jgi:hypothetical protein